MTVQTKGASKLVIIMLAAALSGCAPTPPVAPAVAPAPAAQTVLPPLTDTISDNQDCQGSYSQSGSLVDTSAPLRGNIMLRIRLSANRQSIESTRNGISDGPPAPATSSNGLNAVFANRVSIKNLSLGSLMSGTLIVPNGGTMVSYLINGFCGPTEF
jgi:hypothetical protein